MELSLGIGKMIVSRFYVKIVMGKMVLLQY